MEKVSPKVKVKKQILKREEIRSCMYCTKMNAVIHTYKSKDVVIVPYKHSI